ncbi:MAG: SpoIVB peptidase [Clostridiales bacterium]|nr:SpoIVB peptidase [Clostridiales bacterium]
MLRKAGGCFSLLLAGWMAFSPTAVALRSLPETYRLTVGGVYQVDTGIAVLSSQDESLRVLGGNVTAGETGEKQVSIDLFGLLPIRKLRLKVDEETRLIPGGAAVGVALATKGVLVIGVSDVSGQNPSQRAGLRSGDVIESLNGEEITDSAHLTSLVAAARGGPIDVSYRRDGVLRSARLTPILDRASGRWRIGAWVRDSTAGVGTLSYYDPANQTYGALGHAINDGDTGKLLPVRAGSLLKAQIVDVRKGQKGSPGELRGTFLQEKTILGDIRENTDLGIYGTLDAAYENALYPDGLPVGYQESVTTGPATILSTVDGGGVQEYQVEIIQKSRQMVPGQKSMVIQVTDERLLQKTGGIVQGMSGSPIIQNGRIVGAVTHVFVDDPTKGYGLYIEWMLQTAAYMDEAA